MVVVSCNNSSPSLVNVTISGNSASPPILCNGFTVTQKLLYQVIPRVKSTFLLEDSCYNSIRGLAGIRSIHIFVDRQRKNRYPLTCHRHPQPPVRDIDGNPRLVPLVKPDMVPTNTAPPTLPPNRSPTKRYDWQQRPLASMPMARAYLPMAETRCQRYLGEYRGSDRF